MNCCCVTTPNPKATRVKYRETYTSRLRQEIKGMSVSSAAKRQEMKTSTSPKRSQNGSISSTQNVAPAHYTSILINDPSLKPIEKKNTEEIVSSTNVIVDSTSETINTVSSEQQPTSEATSISTGKSELNTTDVPVSKPYTSHRKTWAPNLANRIREPPSIQTLENKIKISSTVFKAKVEEKCIPKKVLPLTTKRNVYVPKEGAATQNPKLSAAQRVASIRNEKLKSNPPSLSQIKNPKEDRLVPPSLLSSGLGRPSTGPLIRSFKPQLEDIKSSYMLLNKNQRAKTGQREKYWADVQKPKPLDEQERKQQLCEVKKKFQSKQFWIDSKYDKIEGLNWITWK